MGRLSHRRPLFPFSPKKFSQQLPEDEHPSPQKLSQQIPLPFAIPDLPPSTSPLPQNMAFFDSLPLMVWAKNNKHVTIYKNKVYESFENHILLKERLGAPIFSVSQENPLIEKSKKIGRHYKARLMRSVGGQTFAFEACGIPDDMGNTWIFAYDLSDHEREQELFKKSFRQFEATFDHFPLGLAIWGKNQRLQKFNSRFARLFGLDEKWLSRHPSLDEVFEELRQKRMLPEVIDFAEYKRRFQVFFQGVRRPHEEMIHLPDERSFRLCATSYPEGGLMWILEDLTEPLALKRKHNATVSVSSAVSHHIREGILILGVDRKILLMNAMCAEWWGFDHATMGDRTFVEILEACRTHFYYRHYFSGYKNYLINCLLKRTPYKDMIYRSDGLLLQFEYVPLPNGDHMLKFMDITERQRLKELLRESRRLLMVDQYLFLRRVQQFKVNLLEDIPSNDPTPTRSPTPLPPLSGGKLLEQLRHTQIFLGEDRPMIREHLAVEVIVRDLLALFEPLIQEKKLTLHFIKFDESQVVSNKNLFTRFFSRLLGFGLYEALTGTRATISVGRKRERIFFTFSFKVQTNRYAETAWYHPWDLGLTLLKEMASLAGGVLSVSSSHPGRLRLTCLFPDPLRTHKPSTLTRNVISLYKSAS